MKKFLGLGIIAALGLVASVFAFSLHVKEANANTFTPPYITTETLGTAAGAVITSPVLTLIGCDDVGVFADNSAGGASRTLNIDWLGNDGTTILYRRAITVTNGTRKAVSITRFGSASTAGSDETVIGQMPGMKMQFTLAAAGAAAGSLAVYCR